MTARTRTTVVALIAIALSKTDLASIEKKKLQELSTSLRRHIQRGGQTPWQKRVDGSEWSFDGLFNSN